LAGGGRSPSVATDEKASPRGRLGSDLVPVYDPVASCTFDASNTHQPKLSGIRARTIQCMLGIESISS